MKDYYKILEVPAGATEEQIRKAYRRLALKYHPDRNQGDPTAEARFKEVAEAYGVLIDPAKRAQYDEWRRLGSHEKTAGRGFHYSQEEIFRDVFRDPRFSRVFQELFREFERAGVRFDQSYFDKVFFGGRGILFGGVFVWGPFGPSRMHVGRPGERTQVRGSEAAPKKSAGLLKRLGKKIGHYLLGGPRALPGESSGKELQREDLVYDLTLPKEEARRGTWVTVAIDRGLGRETLRVRIPPGIRSGTRLRLKGKGIRRGPVNSDLYLTVHLA